MAPITVRPIHADEWERVRELRLRAVQDPVAAMAFVDSVEHTTALPDMFWRDRAAGGSDDAGDAATARQFITEDGSGTWIGTATGLRERAGDDDFEGRPVHVDGCAVVGVYVAPEHRGHGVVGALVDAIGAWAAAPVRLTVHARNARAIRGYEKAGFTVVGDEFPGTLGPTLDMRRS